MKIKNIHSNLQINIMQRCPSGFKESDLKSDDSERNRGFKSLPLRHIPFGIIISNTLKYEMERRNNNVENEWHYCSSNSISIRKIE